MIIKQPPVFLPPLGDQKHSGLLPDGLGGFGGQGPEADAFAMFLRQASGSGADNAAIGPMIMDLTKTAQGESDSSEFASILMTLMQLKTIPVTVPEQASSEPAIPSTQPGIRRAISAYTPHYSNQGFRQKIDFGSRASFADGISALAPQKLDAGSKESVQTREAPGNIQPVHKIATSQNSPGFLAAHFESKGRPDAIGFDRMGGTCYGIYQLSSRMGTVDTFLKYLDGQAPEWSTRLRAAGPANTRGREGAMPREWQRISSEDPERFARLQHDFIHKKYYKPAMRAVQRRVGLEPEAISPALREVIWSTAVQHGVAGAANIFARAATLLEGTDVGSMQERELIKAVYAERGKRFTGSTQAVQASVKQRFAEEMQLALALLPQSMDRQV